MKKNVLQKTGLESPFAVVASKTSLVEDSVICSQLVHKVYSLVTCHAFLGCTCKCHGTTQIINPS